MNAKFWDARQSLWDSKCVSAQKRCCSLCSKSGLRKGSLLGPNCNPQISLVICTRQRAHAHGGHNCNPSHASPGFWRGSLTMCQVPARSKRWRNKGAGLLHRVPACEGSSGRGSSWKGLWSMKWSSFLLCLALGDGSINSTTAVPCREPTYS